MFAGPEGYHKCFPMDILHVLPGGLFRLIRNALKEIAVSEVLDARLAKMPVVRDADARKMHARS